MELNSKFPPHGHSDMIHDVKYDFYGQRLATCSSDQTIKVWDNDNGNWVLSASWKAHDASVLKIDWAHPEYGNIIASCSFDRSIRIWEEQVEPKRWIEKARLVDSRGTVQDIEFSPSHLGLKLATVSIDGVLRIYEAMDVVSLSHWTLLDDFEINISGREKGTEYCISWCKDRFMPAMFCVGCGKENMVKIFRLDESIRKWLAFEQISHDDLIHDVCWAPSVGRSYQMIATGCKDKHVRIFKINEESLEDKKSFFRVECVADFPNHLSEVWKVDWNITGTILSSADGNGNVMFWKSNCLDEWNQMSVISSSSSVHHVNR
jgi:nucleoporin SEH1